MCTYYIYSKLFLLPWEEKRPQEQHFFFWWKFPHAISPGICKTFMKGNYENRKSIPWKLRFIERRIQLQKLFHSVVKWLLYSKTQSRYPSVQNLFRFQTSWDYRYSEECYISYSFFGFFFLPTLMSVTSWSFSLDGS